MVQDTNAADKRSIANCWCGLVVFVGRFRAFSSIFLGTGRSLAGGQGIGINI